MNNYGYFDYSKIEKLITKFKTGRNISEVDNMALAGILSTQLIHFLFIQRSYNQQSEKLSNLKVIRE